MASITTTALASPPLADGRPAARHPAAAAPNSVGIPNLSRARDPRNTSLHCRRIGRNFIAMATGESPSEVVTEFPEIVKTAQDAWDKLEDKYAVTSLAVAGVIALWVSTGMISAIDRLPLVPGVLELVGIGYTGWFTYQNIVFKPEREALIEKIKSAYYEIIGAAN